MSLSDVKARTAKAEEKPYKLADANGLFLLVNTNGSKLWRWKYRLDGKENLLALGRYPDVGLAEARKARDAARALVAQGTNPAQHKRAERAKRSVENANTFEAVAREWIGKRRTGWSANYIKQVETTLEADVFLKIGSLPIREVNAAQLLEIIQGKEARGAETVALLARQWVSAI